MKLTLDMFIYGIAHYETPEDFFQYVKSELEQQRESEPYRDVTLDNVVKKTSMAIDFFRRDEIVDKAVTETAKNRSEIEEFLDKIESYPQDQ